MKRSILITLTLVAMVVLANRSTKADTISAGGVSYTFTSVGTDSPNVFDVMLHIDTTAGVSGTLSSFSVQFTGATSVSLESSPSNAWSVQGQGPNNPSGCNINGSANLWCSSGPAISVPGSSYDFVFDVTMPGGTPLPTTTHIQAFQGQGALAISSDVGIGAPEPSSLAMLGFGLISLVGFGRRRFHV